jgi:[ribosomal protein S18]-alanine N-acetyltransferase
VEGLTLPTGVSVRPLAADDVDAVVAIEAEAFTTPWSADTFVGLMDRDTVESLVMVDDLGTVLGYAVLWCILDQGELANIAIVPDRRGGGLGAWLLHKVCDVARSRGVKKLFLEVRTSNEAAIGLYRRFGFNDVGARRDYYESPREDALVMLATLGRPE